MCEHKWIDKEKHVQVKVDFLGGRKRQMIYTLVCEKCGELAFRIRPAGEDEK